MYTQFPDPAQLLAFEDGIVYYDKRDGGNRAWTVDLGEVEKLGTGASNVFGRRERPLGVTMTPKGNGFEIRKDRRVVAELPSTYFSWQLSADARWVVGRGAAPGTSGETRSVPLPRCGMPLTGEERATGLPDGALVVGVWPGNAGQIVYAVARSLGGPVDLVSCDTGSTVCDTVRWDHAADSAPVVLPEDFFSKEPTQ